MVSLRKILKEAANDLLQAHNKASNDFFAALKGQGLPSRRRFLTSGLAAVVAGAGVASFHIGSEISERFDNKSLLAKMLIDTHPEIEESVLQNIAQEHEAKFERHLGMGIATVSAALTYMHMGTETYKDFLQSKDYQILAVPFAMNGLLYSILPWKENVDGYNARSRQISEIFQQYDVSYVQAHSIFKVIEEYQEGKLNELYFVLPTLAAMCAHKHIEEASLEYTEDITGPRGPWD